MSARLDWMISVDDHVLEPPHVWESRLPAKYRDVGPTIRRDDAGEAWFFEGKRMPTIGLAAAAGKKREEFSPLPMTYDEMRPGCYDPRARLEDMDRDRVLASLCFPSFPRFCGQTFYEAQDRELGLLCVQAYNDWMLEEWAGSAPGRFIPMIIIPLWDPMLAREEIERTAGLGAKAVAFSENPVPLGLPSIHDRDRYWEPVFAAAAETGMALCTHLGSSSKLPRTAPDMPMIATIALQPINIASTCIDWLFSGVLPRHPGLKVCLSEGGIGWIPYVLERCDYVVERQGYWASKGDFEGDLSSGEAKLVEGTGAELGALPSQLFRDHLYGCFIDDAHGAQSIEAIGVDNVMIETDYPHTDSTWPNSMAIAHERLGYLPEDVQFKVLRGNAERVFDFTPADLPDLAGP
ncbi:MAG TPA: amidohydrolase family protein [Acidimicrobiales bacterium]|nr:amidohydrolase family protein [Acidimicrobiales bacterium]